MLEMLGTSAVGVAAVFSACVLLVAASGLGRRAARAPVFVVAAAAALSLVYRAVGGPYAPGELVGGVAEALLACLVFAAAAQLRISELVTRRPAAARLAFHAGPLFLLGCGSASFVLLPQLSLPGAMLLGAILMLNGAAFDRRAITAAPAPAAVKAAVRTEGAAAVAFGAPVAVAMTAFASTQADAALAAASLAMVNGFSVGGLCGLLAARIGNRAVRVDGVRGARLSAKAAIGAAAVAFAGAGWMGGDLLCAALGVGLLWGEDTRAPAGVRARLRSVTESSVSPWAYAAFGILFAPLVLDAELLSVLFALAAVTVIRIAPRLAVLQPLGLDRRTATFLAWFGGAPGAASALYLSTLIAKPGLADQDAIVTVGAMAIFAGIAAARLTSEPLAKGYVRAHAAARAGR